MSISKIHAISFLFNGTSRCFNKNSILNFGWISRSMSTTMRAVLIRSTGDESVLNVETIPVPEISSNQVLVEIHAAGLNPVDTYIREKKFGYDPKLPVVLGGEAAGKIVKLGKEAEKKYKVNDHVICSLHAPNYGGYAEYVACDVTDLIPLTHNLSFSQGAAVYVPYFTAYKALVARCKMQPKELVMVHGASGGVGVAAVQIAKAYGAVVAVSAGSEAGLKLLNDLGADVIVDHREDGHLQKALAKAGRPGFDVIFENRADLNLGSDLAALGVGGRIAIVGSRGPVEVDPRNFIRTEGSVLGVNISKITKEEFVEFSSALVAGMEKGWLKPVVGKEYSIEEIQKAHSDLIKAHGAYGKMVLKIR
ncbi:quinone oxidoreductase-like isoform X1 [Homalodisca vitripennis]|uniref:quinone oxidoreductase-like isoform X1 n=1 Tax=Homalodisca vitripennis TaxID=197043 RepID=UPI001EEB571D|nr:quinone oxidoreductase-like isoform X1 [Homalodisca vitripennis]